MAILRMHHVGIILPEESQAKDLMNILGMEEDYRSWVEVYSATVIFTKYGQWESPIEFIIPKGGVLAEFNNGKGGIAHVAFEVDDIAATSKDFESRGIKMLEKVPARASEDYIVNFIRPKSAHGILMEFMETVNPARRPGAAA
jgi:lactoylglutathione lyase/methylmalonyl-CoA/ethylmalonyl-CoA epimerase